MWNQSVFAKVNGPQKLKNNENYFKLPWLILGIIGSNSAATLWFRKVFQEKRLTYKKQIRLLLQIILKLSAWSVRSQSQNLKIAWKNNPAFFDAFFLDTGRKLNTPTNLRKDSRCFMYVQFTSCLQGIRTTNKCIKHETWFSFFNLPPLLVLLYLRNASYKNRRFQEDHWTSVHRSDIDHFDWL